MLPLTATPSRTNGEVETGLLTELTVRTAATTTAAQPVTIGLPFKPGDVHSLIHQLAKTTPGKIRLPGQEPEKACNCAVARQW